MMSSQDNNRILYNSYRFSSANTKREGDQGNNRGKLTEDGRMGFDCSGFVDYVVRHSGYEIGKPNEYLPTNAVFNKGTTELSSAAARWQRKIDASDVQPGDLIYFQHHVGLVVKYDAKNGTGVFRSSTTSRGIADDDFSISPGKPSWGRDSKFLAFTRVTSKYVDKNDELTPPDRNKFPSLVMTPSLSRKDDLIWLKTMAAWESSPTKKHPTGGYTSFNGDALGAYQMKERQSLAALGYTDKQGHWLAKVGAEGKPIKSREDFLNSPLTQNAAARAYLPVLKRELKSNHAWDYVGKSIDGRLITEEGLLAAAWHPGSGTVKKHLEEATRPYHPSPLPTFIAARLDQFRGASVHEMSGVSIALAPHTSQGSVVPPPRQDVSVPQPVPDPNAGRVTHNSDRSTTYEFTAPKETDDGWARKGDVVSLTYRDDGTLRTAAIWHLDDGSLETRIRSEDGANETYRRWDRDGKLQTQTEVVLATGQLVGGYVLNGKSYNGDDSAVPDPANVELAAASSAKLPDEAETADAVSASMGAPLYALNHPAINWNDLLPHASTDFLPTGDVVSVIEQLNSRGYTVTQTGESLFAKNPEGQYLLTDSTSIEFGDAERQSRFDLSSGKITRTLTRDDGDKDVATFNAASQKQISKGSIRYVGDDEAAISTTVFPDGHARIVATDADGQMIGRTEARMLPNGASRSDTYDSEDVLRSSAMTVNDGNKVVTVSINAGDGSMSRSLRSAEGDLLCQQPFEHLPAGAAQEITHQERCQGR